MCAKLNRSWKILGLGVAWWLMMCGVGLPVSRAQSPWTLRESETTADLAGVASWGALVVGVGARGVIVTSHDEGATWVRRESGTTVALTAVAYHSSARRLIAVGEGGIILSSPDGITWVRENSPTTVRLAAINNEGVVIGDSGVGMLQREANGVWMQRDAGLGSHPMRALLAGRYFAFGQSGKIFAARADESVNPPLVSWQSVVSPVTSNLEAATDGGFYRGAPPVAVGEGGTILQRVGDAWVVRESGTQRRLRGVCYKGGFLTLITSIATISVGEYFAVGDGGMILRSSDGMAWQADLVPTQRNLTAVTRTESYVIAVGDGGVVVRAGGLGAGPTIIRQPVVKADVSGTYFAEASVAGQGAIIYNWVQFTGGHPYPVGTGFSVQSLAQPPFGVNSLPFQLIVANAFGMVRSDLFTPNRFLNLASRATVGRGEQVLIAGFAIGDVAALRRSRTMLIRAVGPALAQFGVFGALAAPRLTLYSGSQVIASNVGWSTSAEAVAIRAAADKAGAFPLTAGAADSALLVTLPPGNYTAQVTSENGATGVALVEIYDLDPPELSRLKNMSARARVQAGAGAPIGGFVIEGGVKKTVLLRAAGPALADFGVSEVLARPRLTLYRNGQVVATAAEWGAATNVTAIRAATAGVKAFAFGEGSADAALLTDLEPGAYSLIVSAADGGTGVALVEVYELP